MTFKATDSDLKKAMVTGSKEEDLSQQLNKLADSLPRSERLQKDLEFANNHPNSLHAAYLLSVYSSTWGKKKSKELFDNFSDKNKNSDYGKRISKFIELNQSLEIGDQYIDLEIPNTNGEMRRLSEVEGELVLLEFWASNCGPCRQENPNLVKTYNEFKDKGFEIFAVSEDIQKKKWLEAIEEDHLPWLQVSELKGNNTASMIYGVNGIPDNFLIDNNGIIVGRNLRGEKLNDKLKEILN